MLSSTDADTTTPVRSSTGLSPMTAPEVSSPGIRRRWAAFAVVAALTLAFVAGRITDSDRITVLVPAAPTQPGEIAATAPGSPPAATAPGSPPAATAPGSPPIITSSDATDRVAAVAQTAAPSVVQLETAEGLGSGVIYDERGLILTAAHVVAGDDAVAVRLADGRLLEGEVVGRHELTDIAVVRIDSPGPFPVAVLGYNDQLQVGELAVALGSPFGLDQTVTAGIVSAVSRTINGVPMVQTDAAINPGNSGGPLLDANARVIGINDVIFTQGGGSDGIGFAVSIDIAIVVAGQLVAGGDVQLSGLGVSTIASTTGQGGAIVREIVSGSPAETAGLEIGDRIIAIDAEPINNPMQLFAAVVTRRPNTAVTIDFVRNDTQQQVEATLAGIDR